MAQLTIKDIAKICNVGVTTVSRAINNEPGISEATKERIMKVVHEYNYVPNNSARNLKMIESNTIALLVIGIENTFFTSMLGPFEDELRKRGYDFLLHAVSWDQDEVTVATELMKEKRLKGIILLGGQMKRVNERMDALGIPYVLCTVANDSTYSSLDCPWVGIDDEMEAYNAVNYLISKGHKDIALIAGHKQGDAVCGHRYEGYKRALKEHGIKENPDLVHFAKEDSTDFSLENGYNGTRALLKTKAHFTAMFCMSDLIAVGAYKAFNEANIRIPQDCSVIGFDGIDLSYYMSPGLTTMYQPRVEMVVHSVKMLIDKLEDGVKADKKLYMATLIERESVAELETK